MSCKDLYNDFSSSLFELDLAEATLLTPLRGMIFPLDNRGGPTTASYTTDYGTCLVKPVFSNKFSGKTFTADINTYSSMCIVENVQWIDKPSWVSAELIEELHKDADSRGLFVQENSMPIFLISSCKAAAIWSIHRDSIPFRIHHAVKSKGCSMIFFDDDKVKTESVEFQENEAYVLPVSKYHTVYCKNDDLRVHIVVDCGIK